MTMIIKKIKRHSSRHHHKKDLKYTCTTVHVLSDHPDAFKIDKYEIYDIGEMESHSYG